MQHEFVSSTNGDRPMPPLISPLLSLPLDHRIPSPPYHTTTIPDTSPVSFSPSPTSSGYEDPIAIKNRLYLARLALQYQQIADRNEAAYPNSDADLEAEAIIRLNTQLRRATNGMNTITSNQPPMYLLDDHFDRISMAEQPDKASPTSVFGFQNNHRGMQCCGMDDKRLTLPKSISIHSIGYLKIHKTELELQSMRKSEDGRGDPHFEQELDGLNQVLYKLRLDISSVLQSKVEIEKDIELCNLKISSCLKYCQ